MQDEKLWETKTQNGASSKASILRVGNHRQKNRSKDPFTGLLPQGGQKGNTRKNVKRAKPAQAHGESAELSPAVPQPRGPAGQALRVIPLAAEMLLKRIWAGLSRS